MWPADRLPLSSETLHDLAERLRPAFRNRCRELQLKADLTSLLEPVYLPLAAWIARHHEQGMRVLGINGAQGTGKSTLTCLLQTLLEAGFGLRVAVCSIDDIYMTRQERERLARTIHPLLITRGVPGTHDVELGIHTVMGLKNAGPRDRILIPVFDKAMDDRKPQNQWLIWQGRADVILFEGWCVSAHPQPAPLLAKPINDLERREDPDGRWRRYVNDQLKSLYRRLFACLDRLVMFKVPDMECVFQWRLEQERRLGQSLRSHPRPSLRIMDEAQLRRFIQHYERLTRWMIEEMPQRADVVLHLGTDHQIHTIQLNRP